MRVIHLSGTMCSGKSYVSKPFLEHPDVVGWDLLEFYNYNKVLPGGKMDWDRWEAIKDQIVPELDQFLKDNQNKKVCIVESGTNGSIHKYLHRTLTEDIVEIQLKTPDEKTTTRRAKERGLDADRVLEFRDIFLGRHAHNSINQYTQEEASKLIASTILSESIIVRNKKTYEGSGEYIGRGSPLGNKFKMDSEADRDKVIQQYRKWLAEKVIQKPAMGIEINPIQRELFRLLKILKEDGALNLICHCVPKACHGNIVKKCLVWLKAKEI